MGTYMEKTFVHITCIYAKPKIDKNGVGADTKIDAYSGHYSMYSHWPEEMELDIVLSQVSTISM